MNLLFAVFDSTAKLPSGILRGNIKQFGDFDQCIGIKSPKRQDGSLISGKYCLAELDVRLNDKQQYSELDWLIHAKDFMKSAMDDVSEIISNRVCSKY